METLGDRVKILREKKGLNQKKLSEITGITQATISRIENGKVKQLKSDALKRLASGLGSSIDYLMGKTTELSTSEILSSDKNAQFIFRGYEKLSSEGRKELEDFVRWLEEKESKKGD